jgi:hypothetical protein
MVEMAPRRRVPPRWAPYPSPHPPNPTPPGRGATNYPARVLSLPQSVSGKSSGSKKATKVAFSFLWVVGQPLVGSRGRLPRVRVAEAAGASGASGDEFAGRSGKGTLLSGNVCLALTEVCASRHSIRRRHRAFAIRTRALVKIGGSCWPRSFRNLMPNSPRALSTHDLRRASKPRRPTSCWCAHPRRIHAAWLGRAAAVRRPSTGSVWKSCSVTSG